MSNIPYLNFALGEREEFALAFNMQCVSFFFYTIEK